MTLLALVDVDGTLLLSDDPVAGEAFTGALRDCYPVEPPPDAVARTDHPGQTAQRIARLVLRNETLAEEQIDEHLKAWCARFGERYVGRKELHISVRLEPEKAPRVGMNRRDPRRLRRLTENGFHRFALVGCEGRLVYQPDHIRSIGPELRDDRATERVRDEKSRSSL